MIFFPKVSMDYLHDNFSQIPNWKMYLFILLREGMAL